MADQSPGTAPGSTGTPSELLGAILSSNLANYAMMMAIGRVLVAEAAFNEWFVVRPGDPVRREAFEQLIDIEGGWQRIRRMWDSVRDLGLARIARVGETKRAGGWTSGAERTAVLKAASRDDAFDAASAELTRELSAVAALLEQSPLRHHWLPTCPCCGSGEDLTPVVEQPW